MKGPIHGRDFLRPDLGPNIDPFPTKNEQQLPKMVYIIPSLLVLHFGENFMKIISNKQIQRIYVPRHYCTLKND